MSGLADIADVKPDWSMPENDLSRRYLRLLEAWIPVGVAHYAEWDVRPGCGHFFGGTYWYGMETARTAELCMLAALSPEYREQDVGVSRADLLRMATAALRYLCFTHDTGPDDCVRPSSPWSHEQLVGTKWGERGKDFFRQSQCAWSVAPMARTAFMLRDRLDDDLLAMVARVCEDYVTRFADMEPRNGVYLDTQTEENGWTAWGMTAAALFLARHPDAEQWLDAARRWLLAIALTPQDAFNAGMISDRPVRDYFHKLVTTLPDFWAENHDTAHPTYTASGIGFAGATADLHKLHGRPIPPEIYWNRREVYRTLCRTACDHGSFGAPQGMDWPYLWHVVSHWTHVFAAVHLEDPIGAAMLRRALDTTEKRMADAGGRMVEPRIVEKCAHIQDPMIMVEPSAWSLAGCYASLRFFGPGVDPLSDAEVESALAGTATYPHAGIVQHRHARGQAFFSWRNRIMALPQTREGAYFIGPESVTLLGRPVLKEYPESHRLRSIEVSRRENGFAAALVMERCQDSLRQEVLFASLPEGRILSWERFTALKDGTVEGLDQGALAVTNERFPSFGSNCRGERMLYGPDIERRYESRVESSPDDEAIDRFDHPLWLNVDDRLGIWFAGTGVTQYHNHHVHQPFHAVKDDLILSRLETPRTMRAGDEVACLAALLVLSQPHEETPDETLHVLTGPSDAVALLSGDYLAAANFADTDRELVFAMPAGEGPAPLFAGTRFESDGTRWRYSLDVPANGALFRAGMGVVPAAGPVAYECTECGSVFPVVG